MLHACVCVSRFEGNDSKYDNVDKNSVLTGYLSVAFLVANNICSQSASGIFNTAVSDINM